MVSMTPSHPLSISKVDIKSALETNDLPALPPRLEISGADMLQSIRHFFISYLAKKAHIAEKDTTYKLTYSKNNLS